MMTISGALIEIGFEDGGFVVRLDASHRYFSRAYVLVRDLLTSREVGERNKFCVDPFDLIALRKKFQQFGLLDHALITDEAYEAQRQVDEDLEIDKQIKAGQYNDYTRTLLDGKLKTQLYDDQFTAVTYLMRHWRAGLFDDMGVGKTITSLASVEALGDEVERVLVICPANVVVDFSKQITKHTHQKFLAAPSGQGAALKFVKKHVNDDWKYLLVHPENLIFRKSKGTMGDAAANELTKFLATLPFDMVIVDEFHMYKTPDAKRSICVTHLLSRIQDRHGRPVRAVPMTGTPLSETPMTAYTALKILGTKWLPHVSVFEDYFCVKEPTDIWTRDKKGNKIKRRVMKVVRYQNLAELRDRVSAVSIRRTKAEMTGFPDKVVIPRSVIIGGKQLQAYKSVAKGALDELPASGPINLEKFLQKSATVLRLRQILNHPNLLDCDGDSAKYQEIDAILEEVLADPEAKVVLWTAFRKGVENLYYRYNPIYGAVKIYGGVGDLADISARFENDFKPRVAVCTAEKAGTGTDFLARARTSIYVERPYSYVLYKQSIDRIHRRVVTSGTLSTLDRIRSQPATILFLDAVNTVDDVVRERLEQKSGMVAKVTDNMERKDLLRLLRI